MKSFTASTHLGTVRVRLPDDALPSVVQNGRTLAVGIPEEAEVDGQPALEWPTEGGSDSITAVPIGVTEARVVRSASRTDPDGVTETVTDTTASHSLGVFSIPDFPTLFGARLGAKETTVKGFTFVDGVQTLEAWTLDLEPIRRRCCGRK